MTLTEETLNRLAAIPTIQVSPDVPLARHTRFGIGGRAGIFAESSGEEGLVAAWQVVQSSGLPCVVIGGGTNLIVSDDGFQGVILRFTGSRLMAAGGRVSAGAGAALQDLVDFANEHGLRGLETLAGIPGWTGGAVYGNAGAYGHSISECVRKVRFLDNGAVRTFDNDACEFRYRESIFKRHKDWVILSTDLQLDPDDAATLRETSAGIVKTRNEKFPPTMRCAGSIFKNFLLADLPPHAAAQVPATVIREGKVPAAWFLEQIGAKGMQRGGIRIATYHANLIYNEGDGTAADLCSLILELKSRVRDRFGIEVEEEVQYVGY